MSFQDFLNAMKHNPNLHFTTMKDNVPYTTLKELKIEEQSSIDQCKSTKSPYGLTCYIAHRYPELTCDCKKESDVKLTETNPINRTFRIYLSKKQK